LPTLDLIAISKTMILNGTCTISPKIKRKSHSLLGVYKYKHSYIMDVKSLQSLFLVRK